MKSQYPPAVVEAVKSVTSKVMDATLLEADLYALVDVALKSFSSSESTVTGQLAQKLLEIDAARYRYLRKYGWDLITLPPSTAHNEENATGPANLDELVDRSIARIAEGSSR